MEIVLKGKLKKNSLDTFAILEGSNLNFFQILLTQSI
jgi:hypothetical protein